jgi:hypothetical protein
LQIADLRLKIENKFCKSAIYNLQSAIREGNTMNIGDVLHQFISGVRMLAVPRIEDLPYWGSPPIQFVYEQTAPLVLGQYVFNGVPAPLAIPRPLLVQAMYYFRNITLTADISEEDYTLSILSTAQTPQFQLYKLSDNGIQLFREPVRMTSFFQQFDYRLAWQTQQSNDVLTGSVFGTLNQTAGLIGKTSVTIKAVIAAQEIIDDKFTSLFRDQPYPKAV